MLSCFSHVWLFVTLWTVACQHPLSMGLQARILEWVAMPSCSIKMYIMLLLLFFFKVRIWIGSWIPLQCGSPGFHPWVGKIPWRRAWQPPPLFLPGESQWTEEPGGLQSMGLQRVGHNWVNKQSTTKSVAWLSWAPVLSVIKWVG